MKLQKSAKLAVTAGLALSMTLGVAAPVVASAASGSVEQKAAKTVKVRYYDTRSNWDVETGNYVEYVERDVDASNWNKAPEGWSHGGYKFAGWYTDSSCTTPVPEDYVQQMIDKNPEATLEFYAKWEKVAESIQWATATFYDEGGMTVLGTADYQVNEPLNFWATTPAPRDGYTFKGYAIKGKESDGVVDPMTVTMSATGMQFVAVWEKNAPDAQWAKATFLDADGKTVIGTADYQIGETLDVWAVTPAPRRGYCFKGYYIATKPDAIVNPRQVTMSKDGMTFVAVWQPISVPTPNPNPNPTPTPNPNPTPTPTPKPDKPFEDVATNMWYAKPIAQAKKLGYVNGDATTGLFYPQRSITRADAVCILFNMAGGKNMSDDLFSKDGGKTFESGFSDVSGDAYYAKALAWAKKTGVANGYGDGTFKPGQEISREEFAALLSNYAKLKGDYKAPTKDLSSFNDVSSVSDWAKTAVAWAVENEVMGNGGFLAGQSDITRAEVAAMAVNYQPEAVKTPVDGK